MYRKVCSTDDGTNGTHMVTFGTASVKAAESEASVRIDNLPQYFYLKAYLVDSESYRPLSTAYENSNYTEDMKEFFEYSIYDFEPEDVWNFDDNPNNNFMVLTDEAVTINMELQISSEDIEYTANSIRVKNCNLDGNFANLKKGSPFMLFIKEDEMVYGIISSISTDGNEAVIEYEEAQLGDLFEYIRIETANVVDDKESAIAYVEDISTFSDYTEETQVVTYGTDEEQVYTNYVNETKVFNAYADETSVLSSKAKSSDYSDYKNATIDKFDTSFSPIRFELKATTNDDKADADKKPLEGSVTGSGTLQFNVKSDATLYYKKDFKDLIFEITVTPTATVTVSGKGTISYTNSAPLNITIAAFMVGPAKIGDIKASLSAGYALTVEASGTITLSTKYTAAADLNKSEHDDILTFKSEPQQPDISGKLAVTFSMPITLTVSASLLDNPWKAAAKVSTSVSLTGSLGGALKSDNLIGNQKHDCNFCVDGTLSLKLDGQIDFESPALNLLNIGNKEGKLTYKLTRIPVSGVWLNLPVELVPEDFQKFYINDKDGLVWGKSCDNYSYRTYIHVIAEDDSTQNNGIRDAYVINKTEIYDDGNMLADHEDRTNRGGVATIYINPRKNTNVIINVSDLPNTDNINENNYARGIFDDTDHVIRITNPDTFEADQNITIPVKLTGTPTEIVPYPVESDAVPKYKVGEDLRYSGLTVTYGTGDGARTFKVDLTDDMIKKFDSTVVGKQTVVLEFNGFSWTQEIEIIGDKREVKSISIDTLPNKLVYNLNEDIDLSGMILLVQFIDGTSTHVRFANTGGIVAEPDTYFPGYVFNYPLFGYTQLPGTEKLIIELIRLSDNKSYSVEITITILENGLYKFADNETSSKTTEEIDTELQPEEPQTETAEVNETPTFGNDGSGIFGFGRSGIKTAQYANLHKNDIYNYYVVRSTAANLLDKDNLLFVGQGSSDSMGSLSFEYETTTGEDGTIILRPMSDDPTTPDTPNQPTAPDNSGSTSNTNPSTVIPVGGTKTETMTVKVENKVTGKSSKAIAQKTGSSVTVKLGTENNGYYANVYTTDDEYIYSALIENGRAKFNVPEDIKIKIVIDSISYGEDVSSAAGASADDEPVNISYPVIIVLIAVFGIYIKVGKKYLDQKKQR